MIKKARIAHLAGPMATIQNTPPLVTSNKARAKYALPLLTDIEGQPVRFDVLRNQRLALPVTVYVEQFSAHPLEADAAELYGPPDAYLDADGKVHAVRQSAGDRPVYAIELKPEDGVYPLPYMARQADGTAWEDELAYPFAPETHVRQAFFPDGARSFEEIDRLGIGYDGLGNMISSHADVDFFRVLPPGGFRNGATPERRGEDYFPYRPRHLAAAPSRRALARATNAVQAILASGKYDGAVWTEGSPTTEETIYWFNLLIDTTLPICGNSAQRPQGMISNDGPKNIVDSVEFIASRVWADEQGRNAVGAVMIQELRIFTARSVQKADARPGGYVATGGHGGIIGAVGRDEPPVIHFHPTLRHTWKSAVNLTSLPDTVGGVRRAGGVIATVPVAIKGADGLLLETAIPKVMIAKDASYWSDDADVDLEAEADLVGMMARMLDTAPLAGFVVEGMTPYGSNIASARHRVMLRAVYSGIPVVRTGRGNTEGFVTPRDPSFIAGSNLTSTKARILLMAALMKFGALPPAADSDHPTPAEIAATREKVADYQGIFNSH